ncbi:Dolichyldiphosphatase 1 [Kappamyces sp. JEL0680]|nr:Dolichyldiphosphatase 1 [Kappamyces sp. JEL0680]
MQLPQTSHQCSSPPTVETLNLKPFSLTHVMYEKDDVLGLLFAASTLLPLAMLVSYVTLIVETRRKTVGFMFAGQLLNEGVNAVVKRIVKEPRPSTLVTSFGKYGMPSSHSQFMWYFAGFSLLYLAKHKPITMQYVGLYLCIISACVVVSVSRVYLLYHTTRQVGVGAMVGWLFGLGWYFLGASLSLYPSRRITVSGPKSKKKTE